ncbi:Hypothetical predicted protein [Xyrichtys novacula]|uniref:Uncharacterized protein n=1 Tax=Xyrichtys novacula TaxID=13765 RepID=A0AAV1G7M5_XYRNO|nr:Hypothetical predicted protein [Xyrichtys novacula]
MARFQTVGRRNQRKEKQKKINKKQEVEGNFWMLRNQDIKKEPHDWWLNPNVHPALWVGASGSANAEGCLHQGFIRLSSSH